MLLLFKIIMPWLKAKEEEDQAAQDKYEMQMEIQDASGEGCCPWCNRRWVRQCQWCGNAVRGLPRFVRGQFRQVLWWFDAGESAADEGPKWLDLILFGIFSPVGVFLFVLRGSEERTKVIKTFTELNDMMKVAVLAFATTSVSTFIIGSTWSAFYSYQGVGNDASMAFVADIYHHTFAIFTGSLELPALDFDFTVLWKDAWCVLRGCGWGSKLVTPV